MPTSNDDNLNWGHCPYCGSSAIQGGSVDIEDRWALQEVTCDECNNGWIEVYKAERREPRT